MGKLIKEAKNTVYTIYVKNGTRTKPKKKKKLMYLDNKATTKNNKSRNTWIQRSEKDLKLGNHNSRKYNHFK